LTTSDDVRTFLIEEMLFTGSRHELTDDYPLLERAVLDSNGLIRLITHLEERCSIEIDDEEIVPENFSTIGHISAFVEAKRAA
jgi:acyl carrier protein